MFRQVSILAPGLLGASLGWAVRNRRVAERVTVWARREATREACRGLQWCDAVYSDPVEACGGADLVVVCAPVGAIAGLVRQVVPQLADESLVTDVGSTKLEICRALAEGKAATHFVGSHPMAGSEKSGLWNADPDLFEGRTCMVTPLPTHAEASVDRIEAFWRALGMKVQRVSPDEHDAIVAAVSHLPHALASVLAAHLGRKKPDLACFAGAGLADTTRIAAGNPEIWMDIFRQNRTAVLESLKHFGKDLERMIEMLELSSEEPLRQLLNDGRAFRENLEKVRGENE